MSGRAGTLFPPVVGTCTDGRGDFYGQDVHDGRPIKSPVIWPGIADTSARWEQESSAVPSPRLGPAVGPGTPADSDAYAGLDETVGDQEFSTLMRKERDT